MAKALIGGLKINGFSMPAISVIEPDPKKRLALNEEFGVHVTEQLPSVANAEVIVLAVKPQQLRDVAIFLGSLLQKQLIISVAAGVRTTDLARWLGGYESIVRVMPNTPAQIQRGMTALYAMPQVTSKQHDVAETIMAAVGATLWLDEESKLDAVTALSGSGPAYVFYFIEAMLQAGMELGLSETESATLSLHTFIGASELAAQSAEPPQTLRAQVTSKGGTTESAMHALESASVKSAIIKAVYAAAKRSNELGDSLGKD